jgi:hypothetical protein
VGGSLAVPPYSFVTGSEVSIDKLILGYALMDLTPPGAPEVLSEVHDVISAYLAREVAILEGEGGSTKRKNKNGQTPRKGPKNKYLAFLCTWPW